MKTENQIAFKEWAAIVGALSSGKQILIVRKGGIREESGEFEVEHKEFFLFPTFEHQNAEDLKPEARHFLEEAISVPLPSPWGRGKGEGDNIPIQFYAETKSVVQVTDEHDIDLLDPYHVWSKKAVTQRFHFGKNKGLFVLAARIYRLPNVTVVPFQAEYGGCKSWVELESSLTTAGALPVVSDSEFESRLQSINSLTLNFQII